MSCWHQVIDALNFLDGLSPQEAVEQLTIHHKMPSAIEQFKESEVGKELFHTRYPEWEIMLHNTIWERYGEKLFEIYDLRHPDLWEQYVHFVRGYYKITGISPYPGAPGNEQMC